ncbi:MAG: winged helix DNA-binding domain-containing protein [Candidatus Hodarchaeota archaeon]
MDTFNLNQVNKLVLQKHHLTEDDKIDDIIQITEDLCGLHSTDLKTSHLSLFVRTRNFKKVDLEKELYINKTMGRIRGMRRTLFIQTKNMIPIVHAATFELSEKTFQKYMEYHGIFIKDYHEISKFIIEKLKGRELSASEIRKELNSKLNIPAIIQLMCNYGLLIRGRPIKDWKDRRNKYVLFKEQFPNIDLAEMDEENAIKQLVKRYIITYGPVTENDISWWTGLTKTKIRGAFNNFEKQLERVRISNVKGNFIISKSDINHLKDINNPEEKFLNFLPELDPYLMGYKDRQRYIDSSNKNKVFDRSGNATATILINGKIIGVWDIEEKPEPLLKFYLFTSIEDNLKNELHDKAQRIGKFYLDTNVQIKECTSMTPLTERKAGGFMSPLKNC